MKLAAAILLALAAPVLARDLPTQETPVGRLSLMIIENSLVVSPDSGRLAFGTKAGILSLRDKGVFTNASGTPIPEKPPEPGLPKDIRATVTLSIDEKMVPEAEKLTPALFSPDSKHVAFGAMRSGKWSIVVDNRTVARDADALPAAPIAFSPDSARYACIVQKDDRFIVTSDGKSWPPVDAVAMGMLTFSPDSQHLAALARIKTNWVLFVDGKPLPSPIATTAPAASRPGIAPKSLDRLGQFVWRPDSAALGYYAAFTGSRWQIFSQTLDGQIVYASSLADAVLKDSPIYSPDNAHLAFGAQARNKWLIITDTASSPEPPFDALRSESLTWISPAGHDSPVLFYLALRGKKWQLYQDHQPTGDPFDAIVDASFTVSPDRHHYAFAGMRSGKAVIIRDGAAIATHDLAGANSFAFSPDSQHLAYAQSTDGHWSAAVDGSPGSATFAGLAQAPIAFSPDSRQIAFTAMESNKTWRLIVGKDGDYQSHPFDTFIKGADVRWGARKDAEGNPLISALAISKKVALRVEARAP